MSLQDTPPSVFTPRLLAALRSGVAPAADTPVKVLIKFQTDAALGQFLANQNQPAAADAGKRFTVTRALTSIRTVAVEIRVDALQQLGAQATETGIHSIDEDFPVKALLDETAVIEKVQIARDNGLTGHGIRIAVVDTGIDDGHPDLVGVVESHFDATGSGGGDSVGHGTHVASIIAGRGVRDHTKVGLAPGATLIDVKVLGPGGGGSASTVAAGIEHAVAQGAQIINMSLGASGPFDGSDPLSEAANWAVAQGVVVCVAAGNCGPAGSMLECVARGAKTIDTPGCAKDVITVGAINKDGTMADYSSRGPSWGGLDKPDVVTVGSSIVAARATGTSMGDPVDQYYTRASGTSMATPVCTSLVALTLEAAKRSGQKVAPAQVKQLLQQRATLVGGGVDAASQGKGFVSAQGLFDLMKQGAPAALSVVSFQPDAGPAVAATSQLWILTVKNSGAQALYDVGVACDPTAGLTIGAQGAAVDSIQPGASARFSFMVRPANAGNFAVGATATFRTTQGGDAQQQSLSVAAVVTEAQQAPPNPAPAAPARLDVVLDDAVGKLLAMQNSDGTWAGSIMYNAWTNGMFCILYRILGLPEPTSALDWLTAHRSGLTPEGNPDGTWGIIDDASIHFLEACTVAEIALEIWGRGRNQQVWDFFDQTSESRLAPAFSLLDPFSQVFAALAGDYAPQGTDPYFPIANILAPPIELLLAPVILPFSLPNLAGAWGQDALRALMIIVTVKSGSGTSLFKQIMLKKAEAALLNSQNEDGSWYGTALPSLAATLAMHVLGYENSHPVMKAALNFLQQRERADGYVERYRLPVWDTSLAVLSLRAAGLDSDHPRLTQAGQYLMASQRQVDGGVPFRKENTHWPDTDDTAFSMLALNQIDMGSSEPLKAAAIESGLRWLLFMQGNEGGWAAFAKDQSVAVKGRIPLFKDDPPTADVTGHVMSALSMPRGDTTDARAAFDRGLAWLQQYQLAQGQWFGRWGLTYTYGTAAVLLALADGGEDMSHDYVTQGVEYLLSTQQKDGGWGEGIATYYDYLARETVPSTPDQTAWSIMALMAVPRSARTDDAIEKGIQFLLNLYDAGAGWPNGAYTVGAIWVYKNTLYPLLWGVWALATYKKFSGGR